MAGGWLNVAEKILLGLELVYYSSERLDLQTYSPVPPEFPNHPVWGTLFLHLVPLFTWELKTFFPLFHFKEIKEIL